MSGDIELGKCDICRKTNPLFRTYYYYDVKCECCVNEFHQHFEYVACCVVCEPKPPKRVSAWLIPVNRGEKKLSVAEVVPYQKCPVCDGNGEVWESTLRDTKELSVGWNTCTTCKGEKVIPMYVSGADSIDNGE